MSLIIPSFLGILSLTILVYLLLVILKPIFPNFLSFFNINLFEKLKNLQLSKKENLYSRALKTKNFADLKNAFFLESKASDKNALSKINKLHGDILNTIEVIVHENSLNFSSLATLRELNKERIQLLNAQLDLRISKVNISKSRKTKQKETPAWAFKDFDKKIRETINTLDQNKSDFLLILKKLEEQIINIEDLNNSEKRTLH